MQFPLLRVGKSKSWPIMYLILFPKRNNYKQYISKLVKNDLRKSVETLLLEESFVIRFPFHQSISFLSSRRLGNVTIERPINYKQTTTKTK